MTETPEAARAPTADNPSWQAELLTLYQVTAEDLTFFKQQQWSVTNYVLILDAAIIGARQLVGNRTSEFEKLVLCRLATLLAVLGACLVLSLERSIKARRDRLMIMRDSFSEQFRAAWYTPRKAPDAPTVAVLLGAALLGGVAMVWWVVWLRGV